MNISLGLRSSLVGHVQRRRLQIVTRKHSSMLWHLLSLLFQYLSRLLMSVVRATMYPRVPIDVNIEIYFTLFSRFN